MKVVSDVFIYNELLTVCLNESLLATDEYKIVTVSYSS